MPKILGKEIQRAHLWLFTEDLIRIDRLCATSKSNLKRSDMIRQIIHATLNKIEEKANARANTLNAELDLGDAAVPAGRSGRDEPERVNEP
jgi:hypothetical protein